MQHDFSQKNALTIIFVGTALSAVLGLLSNIFLARSIPIETFGNIVFFYTSIVTVFSLMEMGFGTHYVVKVNESSKFFPKPRNKEVNWLYRQIRIRFGFPLGVLLTALLAYIYNLTILDYFGVIVGAFCLIHHKFLLSVLQVNENWFSFSFSQCIPVICRFIAYVIVIYGLAFYIDNSSVLIIIKIALCLSLVAASILVEYLTPSNYLSIKKYNSTMSSFLYKGFFIQVLINSTIVLFTRIDIFLLMYFVEPEVVAIYFAANNISMFFPIATRSLMNYYLQKVAVVSNLEAERLLGKQLYLIPVGIIVASTLFIFGTEIMTIFFGNNYSNGGIILGILGVGYITGIIFTPFETYFYNRNAIVVLNVKIASFFIMVIFSLLLIDSYGSVGIALSVTIAKLAGWLVLVLSYFKFKKNEEHI